MILAWTNDARFVFEQNCNHSRHWTVPTQKGLKLLTFQSSLREIRGNWHILLSRLGVRDPARKVMLECDCTSKHLRRKKCSHQSPNPKFTWKSPFLTAFVQKCTSSFDGAALPQRLWTLKGFPFEPCVLHCFAMFFPFANGGGPFKHRTYRMPP